MMKNLPIKQLKNWLSILCTWGLLTGCATSLMNHQERFEGEGFRVSMPNLQTRAVVWGNHSEAVKQASDWLNDEQILVLYRLADKDNTVLASQAEAESQAHMLSAARRVGAPLVVFLEVKETPAEQTINPMAADDQTPKIIEVEIRGMNAGTRDLVFGSTVRNAVPREVSNQLVTDLTSFALRKALKEPQSSFPPQQLVQKQDKIRGLRQDHSTQNVKKISAGLPASQPKKTVTNLSPSTNANLSKTKHQPTLPLQQKLPQHGKPGEKITAPTARHSEKMPLASASPPDRNQPTILAQQSPNSRQVGEKERVEVDITPIASPADDGIRETELQPARSRGFDETQPMEESSVGIQVASGALSLLYTPIKVTYAVLGGFFGGFAYILTGGNTETATAIWDSSLGGTYLIQPDHLRGDESILFMGPPSNPENAF